MKGDYPVYDNGWLWSAHIIAFSVRWVGPNYEIKDSTMSDWAFSETNSEHVSASDTVRCEQDAMEYVSKMLPKGARIIDVHRYVNLTPAREGEFTK